MKHNLRLYALQLMIALGLILNGTAALAEGDELDKEETELAETTKGETFNTQLKEKYQLTDDQVKKMTDAGMNRPHMVMTSQLAQSSGKTIDDVMKMRLEQKMGWGKIAKELGLHPSEIGKSVSSFRHDLHDARHEAREGRHADRKAAHEERKAERREQRELRKQERADRRGKAGK
ncbi:MAG: hypothetical protein NDI61_07450 [Bdellovibrionaceae bacterium]|nr:hypothetical protein [Pseudobdellovibrionaceae bacterium]